jgi:hypothetical protein
MDNEILGTLLKGMMGGGRVNNDYCAEGMRSPPSGGSEKPDKMTILLPLIMQMLQSKTTPKSEPAAPPAPAPEPEKTLDNFTVIN